MAYFIVKVCTSASGAWVAGSEVVLATTNSLYFGSSSRATFRKKINVDAWNDSMHVGLTTAVGSGDKCAGSHAHNVKYIAASTAQFDNGSDAAVTTMTTSQAVRVYFTLSTSITVNDAKFWFGSGSTAQSDPVNASCRAFMKGNSSWSLPKPSTYLQLTTSLSGTGMSWYLGFSVKPLSVGFNNSNKMKVEVTYS